MQNIPQDDSIKASKGHKMITIEPIISASGLMLLLLGAFIGPPPQNFILACIFLRVVRVHKRRFCVVMLDVLDI